MTPIEPGMVSIIQQTWVIIEADPKQTSALFYDNLFIADPSLVPLFGENMTEQGKKLMKMLRFAVQELDNPARFTHAFQELGRRHVEYGVQKEQYTTVGEALLKTLEQSLGDRFTPAAREAWTTFYGVMAETMLAAAEAGTS